MVLVAGVLQSVDLDPVVLERGHRLQPGHRLGGELGTALDHLDLLRQLGRHHLHLVEQDQVDDLVHHVHHVVEPGAERVDVLAVERRHERAVDALDQCVSRLVGLVLGRPHPGRDILLVGGLGQHLREELGPDDEVLGRLGEEVVERRVERAKAQTHGCTPDEALVNEERTAFMLGGAARRSATQGSLQRRRLDRRSSAGAGARSGSPGGGPMPLLRTQAPSRCRSHALVSGSKARSRSSRMDVHALLTGEPHQHLHPSVEVAVHHVGRPDPGHRVAGVLEPEDPAVLEEPTEHRADGDVSRTGRVRRVAASRCRAPAARPALPPARRGRARRSWPRRRSSWPSSGSGQEARPGDGGPPP